jgi:3-methyladenine DNA glycosylase/8-oxoguanine DNA glycosylase
MPSRLGMDGMLRRRPGGVLERLLHLGEVPVVVRAAQTAEKRVLFGAWSPEREAAAHGIRRMRFALGVDDHLGDFLRRFANDPLIGRSVRRRPWLRVSRRPGAFEALAWAITEQLIEYERAAAIQRRMLAALGRRVSAGGPGAIGAGLRDLPTPAVIAGTAPARLQSFDLAASRSLAMVRAAREVAAGRLDLDCADHEAGWRRLRAIPGIGAWTVEILALAGQGRHDQLPAGDLGLLKLVGGILSGGDPTAVADERQVRELFLPYGEWAGLAAVHLLGAGVQRRLPVAVRSRSSSSAKVGQAWTAREAWASSSPSTGVPSITG